MTVVEDLQQLADVVATIEANGAEVEDVDVEIREEKAGVFKSLAAALSGGEREAVYDLRLTASNFETPEDVDRKEVSDPADIPLDGEGGDD